MEGGVTEGSSAGRGFLRQLKTLTEQILSQGDKSFAIDLITSIVAGILKHGRLSTTTTNYVVGPDNRVLVDGTLLEHLIGARKEWDPLPSSLTAMDVESWISARYTEHSLSPCIAKLTGKRDLMQTLYTEHAVLRLPLYREAILLCLRACEENRPGLLAEIDPSLYLKGNHHAELVKAKRASHSLPIISVNTPSLSASDVDVSKQKRSLTFSSEQSSLHKEVCQKRACEECIVETVEELVHNVTRMKLDQVKDKVQARNPAKGITSKISGKLSHRRSRSDIPFTLHSKPQPDPPLITRSHSRSGEGEGLEERTMGRALEVAKKTLLDIRLKVLENSIEEERENSHFQVSEMLIAAVEQMKWRQVLANSNQAYLAHFINPTPLPLLRAMNPGQKQQDLSGESSGIGQSRVTGYTTSEEAYPHSEVSIGSQDDSSSHGGMDISGDFSSPSTSRNLFSPDFTTEIPTSPPEGTLKRQSSCETGNSAEAVAAQLLENISNLTKKEQPKFFVSYKDAPQFLLPLPEATEFLISPDGSGVRGRLERGNSVWAPPREQIIFTLHPPPKLKKQLLAQRNRCAGCGMKLERIYIKRVRYCEYSGKFFCQKCHIGSQSQIPSRILHRWDFDPYPVCDMAQRFLGNHMEEPLFNVQAINPGLYQSVKPLKVMHLKRKHLRLMWDYVRTCRVALGVVTRDGTLSELFNGLPRHFLEEEDLYSIKDFNLIREGTLDRFIDMALYYGRFHIEGCEFCNAKGFLCELCRDGGILFPFQTEKIHRCTECGTCFHNRCFRLLRSKHMNCPRCERLEKRRKTTETEAMRESIAEGMAEGDAAVPFGVDYTSVIKLE